MEDKVIVSIDEINWEEAGRDLEHSVLLKLANKRAVLKKQIVEVLERVWRLSSPAIYYKVEKNIMLILLACKEDQEMVLEGGPWSVKGTAILLHKWEQGMSTGEDFDNTKVNAWVHIHGLPFELRNERFAKEVAEHAGKVKKQRPEAERAQRFGGEFMRLCVKIDTPKPLLPSPFLKRSNRKPTWIYMKYEKLLVCVLPLR